MRHNYTTGRKGIDTTNGDLLLLVTTICLSLFSFLTTFCLVKGSSFDCWIDGILSLIASICCMVTMIMLISDDNYLPDCDLQNDFQFYHCSSAISLRVKNGDYDILISHMGLAWLVAIFFMNAIFSWSKYSSKRIPACSVYSLK